MRLLPRALGSLLLLSASLRADNPYDYRYGTAAYERAAAGRRSDARLNAPVTNSGGYTPDFSATVSEIRRTLGTKLTPEQIVLARRREERARRNDDDDNLPWSQRALPAASRTPPEPPPEPSREERLQTLAGQGDPEALRLLGRREILSSDPQIHRRGIQRLNDSVAKGSEKAAADLIDYFRGHPQENQFPRVLELMAWLSEKGDPHSTRELAEAYLTGIPQRQLAPDPVKARHFLEEGFQRWADGTCGLAIARAYRDGTLYPQDTAKAIATYRSLIDAQSRRTDITPPATYNTAAAGWEWYQLAKQQDPDLHHAGRRDFELWEYAALHAERHTRAAAHSLAAELGAIYGSGRHGPVNAIKAILYLSIATSGDERTTPTDDYDDVVLSNADQARHLYRLAQLLLDVTPAWPQIEVNRKLVASTPADIARLYSRSCYYASIPGDENAANPYPSPFLGLYWLSFDQAYGFKLSDDDRLALLDRGLDLGEVPNDREHPEHLAYAEATYERARLIRALGEIMPDTQHRAALGFQKAWEYGWRPAALPLAELIDDLRLPGKTRADAKEICRLAAEDGDEFCAAQLGTWLTGEVVAQAKPDPALVAEARHFLQQAIDANILRASEDAGYLDAATGNERDAVANFNAVIAKEPTARSRAGLAELQARGRGGLAADPAAALKLLEEAAAEDAFYTVRLAELNRRAEWGLPKDAVKAVELLDTALYRDNEWHAGLELARLYHTGTDVPKDEEKAYEYLDAAGTRGNNETARLIAEAYETGSFITPNADSAAHWRYIAIHGLVLDPG